VAECRPADGGEREQRRLPPQNLRGRDRRHRHRLDLDAGAGLISVDLQEHVAYAQGRALAMGDDDLDLFHAGEYRGMTAGVAPGLPRATTRDPVVAPGRAAGRRVRWWPGLRRHIRTSGGSNQVGSGPCVDSEVNV
jgi:hypothetical protein